MGSNYRGGNHWDDLVFGRGCRQGYGGRNNSVRGASDNCGRGGRNLRNLRSRPVRNRKKCCR